MSENKNPVLVALLSVVPGLINTITSVIRDKKKREVLGDPRNPTDTPEFSNTIQTVKSIAQGIKLSSKRMMNITGTGAMFAIAGKDYLANGLTWEGVALFVVGAIYSTVMAWITHRSEQ